MRALRALQALQALTQLWLLTALPALAGGGRTGEGEGQGAGVRFLPRVRSSYVAAAGQEATLDCRVHQLGDKSVSWVRSRDLQILTHAGVVFTADARVSTSETRGGHAGDGGDGGHGGDAGDGSTSSHVLRIARLRAADSGRYECQVNTEPKLSLFFNLTVLDGALPGVEVTALTRTVRGHAGGATTLACLARYVSAPRHLQEALPPLALSWSGREAPLSLQSARGGVSLEAERGAGRAESRLTLAGLRARDAGAYECCASAPAPAPAPPACATITLLLDDAEEEDGAQLESEAMQRDEQPAGARAGVGAGPRAGGEGSWPALALALALLAHSAAAADLL